MLCVVFAFLVVALARSADVDLFDSANVDSSTVSSIQPSGSLVCGPGRNGTTCGSVCLTQNPQNAIRIQAADEATVRTTINAIQNKDTAFGYSTLVKFDKFSDGTQTLLSIQSSDGSIVYFRINVIAKPNRSPFCLECKTISAEIQWLNEKNKQVENSQIAFNDDLNLDNQDWHYIYVDVKHQLPPSDVGSATAELTFYESCLPQAQQVSLSTISDFPKSIPSSAIVLVGMAKDSSGVINRVSGCLERPLFRTETFQLSLESQNCAYSPCVNCRALDQVKALRADSSKLRQIIDGTAEKITTCLGDPVAPSQRNCTLGCTFDDGTKADVNVEKVVKRGSDGKVCRRCKCQAPEDVVCYDYCYCEIDGETYYDGQKYRKASDGCMECRCDAGSETSCTKVC